MRSRGASTLIAAHASSSCWRCFFICVLALLSFIFASFLTAARFSLWECFGPLYRVCTCRRPWVKAQAYYRWEALEQATQSPMSFILIHIYINDLQWATLFSAAPILAVSVDIFLSHNSPTCRKNVTEKHERRGRWGEEGLRVSYIVSPQNSVNILCYTNTRVPSGS